VDEPAVVVDEPAVVVAIADAYSLLPVVDAGFPWSRARWAAVVSVAPVPTARAQVSMSFVSQPRPLAGAAR